MTACSHARRRLLLGAGALACTSACTIRSNEDHNDPESPTPLPTEGMQGTKATWALVLGSGGPRGFVHVGVIKALEELNIRPPVIVGSSVGALVGALWAAGIGAKKLDEMAMNLSPISVARISIGSDERFSGGALAAFVNHAIDYRRLEQFDTVMIPVAARREDRRLVGFHRGDVGVAVQASAAIEGTFTPVKIRGVEYIDADLVAPVPVRFARQHCARRVISVDASAHEDKAPPGAARFREGDRRKRNLTTPDTSVADLNLHPLIDYYVSLTEAFRRRTIDAGYRETIAQAARIRAALAG